MHGQQNTKFCNLTLSEEQFLYDAVNWLIFINKILYFYVAWEVDL